MAITPNNARLLRYAKSLGVLYTKTIMLGRQELLVNREELASIFKTNGKALPTIDLKSDFAEPLFKLLGATLTDSIDFSTYEGATIIHDLNSPIPTQLRNKYSAVIDGGTLEHIFNFPVAIANCMKLLEVGGYFISFTPANNTFGHGFYQFSSELFYRIFTLDNGFEIKLMAAYTNEGDNWFEVADPEKVKSRVTLINNQPTHLIVIAKKVSEKELFTKAPQQTDYEYAWSLHDAKENNVQFAKDSLLLNYYKKLTPTTIRVMLRSIYDSLFNRHKNVQGLGNVNPAHFKKLNTEE